MKKLLQKSFLQTLKIQSQIILFFTLCLTNVLNAQTNIAPLATASASTCNTGACSTLNDLNYGTCGSQSMWITSSASNPGSSVFIQFDWTGSKTFNKLTIYNGEQNNRFLGGGTIQYLTGSTWTTATTFTQTNMSVCSYDITFTAVTGSAVRIIDIVVTGSQSSNVNFREIEIYDAPPHGGLNILPPIANFFPSQATSASIPNDTVWINSPYNLVSTSTNATRSYWDLPGESPLNAGYGRTNVAWTSQQYIDTAKYNQKFKYTFNRRGFWPVRVLAINDFKRDSLRDSVVKYIWVDTPNNVPKPNFFAARTKIGIGDYASLVDISSNGPNQWYWTFSPACNLCSTPPYFNNFFAGPTDQNPLFFGGDPGKFSICLQVWNARGWDTICKNNYLEVLNSINVCSGSGSNSSSESKGFMFGPSGAGLSYTRSQLTGCTGFQLQPCADSIFLFVDRIKMLPTDTLFIRNGTSASAPILAKLGASNVAQLPNAILTSGIRGGSRIFVHIVTGSGTIPTPYDSAGFSIRWDILPASYGKPISKIVVPDTIFSLQPTQFANASTGTLMSYSWDTDGNGAYDSTTATATRSFLITTPQFKKICLVTYNCVGSDTACKNVLFLPTTTKPVVRFDADKVQGFNTDTFRLMDKSLFGPGSWKWTFTPSASVQFLLGTNSTSRNPIVRFTSRTKYTIKLVATNLYGTDSTTKVDYINIGAYDQPQCLSDINLADGSIGISRVTLLNGIDTAINAYSPCYQLVQGLQSANLYKGKKHVLTVVRPGTSSPMDRKAWIDYNMDGLFTNDELVMNELNKTVLSRTDTVSLANSQMLGSTRMRVGVTYAGTQLNSSVLFLGVFRDYIINFPNDTVKPIASLVGSPVLYTEVHKPFVDPGILALDNIEGNISNKLEVLGNVDTSKVGPNYLRYIVRDLYGNISDTLNRTVFVVLNQTGPTITLLGQANMYVEVYKNFVDPSVLAKDNQGNNITSQVVKTSNVDTSKLGIYSVTYTIIDAFGFIQTASRAVTVGDTTRPWLIAPLNNIYVQQVGSALDLSTIVVPQDNYWSKNNLNLTWTGTVDVNNVGSYYVLYNIRDNSGNIGNEVIIEVRVKDTKPPVVTLKGESTMNVEVYTGFNDPWVNVSDNYWASSTVSVTRKGSVNTNKLGVYTLWYIAIDPSGNIDSVKRDVKVIDSTIPVVNLLGIYDVNLPRWQEYKEYGVQLEDNYNSDAEMRQNLVTTNSLPKNAAGNYFGNSPGLYSVKYKVKDLSGNESVEVKRTINVLASTSSINEVMNIDNLMSVFPNPSNGVVYLKLADILNNDLKITICDLLGKELIVKTLKGSVLDPQEINLNNLNQGIYILKIQSGLNIYQKKIQID